VPLRKASAKRVARLYRKRWTLETAFQHLEAYFHSEINTLGYPKAALFGLAQIGFQGRHRSSLS
jgi:IS4 transposase